MNKKKWMLGLAMTASLLFGGHAIAGEWYLLSTGCSGNHSNPGIYGYAYDAREYGDSTDVEEAFVKKLKAQGYDNDICLDRYEGLSYSANAYGYDSKDDVRAAMHKAVKRCKRHAKNSSFIQDHHISLSKACIKAGKFHLNISN